MNNAACIDLSQVEWHDRKGRRVNLSIKNGMAVASPWLPPLKPGVLINRGIRRTLRDLVVFASGKTNYYISKLVNQFWNATAFSFPTTHYWAGWTTTLTAASTGSSGTEAAYTGYARVAVTVNTTNYGTSAGGSSISNLTAITWPANGGSLSTWTFIAVCDASTAGNMLFFGSITSTAINPGDTPQMNVSALTASEA